MSHSPCPKSVSSLSEMVLLHWGLRWTRSGDITGPSDGEGVLLASSGRRPGFCRAPDRAQERAPPPTGNDRARDVEMSGCWG